MFLPGYVSLYEQNAFTWKDLDLEKLLKINKRRPEFHDYEELFDSLRKVRDFFKISIKLFL